MPTRQRAESLEGFRREMLQAIRGLRRAPVFSLVACATLALAVGAITAIFLALDAVVLRPLPYRDADALVSVVHPAVVPGTGASTWGMSVAGYFHFKEQNRTLDDFGAYRTSSLTVTGDGGAEVTRLGMVTASIITTLQIRPALGRLIHAEDDRPGAPPVVVLGYDYWRRRFGGDLGVVGQLLQTTLGPREIIGVAEPGLHLPKPGPFASTQDLAGFGVDLWAPLRLDPAGPPQNNHILSGIGRLRPGVTPTMAQQDIQALTGRFPELFPSAYSRGFIESYQFRTAVIPLRDDVLGPAIARTLWVLFGAVGLVLLIAVANVANLFLVRGEGRRRESAIRTALGADRSRMMAHFLSESLLLSIVGGAAGLLLAWMGLEVVVALAPRSIPRLAEAGMTWRAGLFALTLSGVVGIGLGLLPLVRTRVDVRALREGGRGMTSGRTPRRVRNGLVIGQVALALVLLAASGLMLRSMLRLGDVRPGLDPTGVLTADISIPFRQYPTLDAGAAFHRQVHQRIAALPGVTEVGGVTALPLSDFDGCSVVFREGRPYGVDEQRPCVATPRATPGFFAALGIEVGGALPTWADVDARLGTAVVTRALANRLWPGENPVGMGITTNGGANSPLGFYRVVGVVPELRGHGLDQPPSEAVFYPPSERVPDVQGDAVHSLVYVVRTSGGDPMALVPAIRKILAELNPDVPLVNPRTMTAVVDQSVARTSFIMTLLAIASVMALVLSAVGIYGVVSYLVAQRRAEIGVRIALGARGSQVAWQVVGQSLLLVVAGVGVGLAVAIAGTRVLRALLFEVSPTDPTVLITVSLVLMAIATVASLGPARRAARVDPIEVLRAE